MEECLEGAFVVISLEEWSSLIEMHDMICHDGAEEEGVRWTYLVVSLSNRLAMSEQPRRPFFCGVTNDNE